MPSAPAHRSKRHRAERRRVPPPPARAAALPALTVSRALTVVWAAATLALLVYTLLGIERKITWYLAVDQYGYLAFAHDLMHGRVFHHWPPIDAFAPSLPPQVDVLSQTYVYDNGRLYCRYAPGFAMLLAAWLTLFGDDGAAYLNPTVFLVLLLVVLAFQMRVFRSRWRATAGVTLIVLFPTFLHWWSLTLVRDLPTHLAAVIGLFLLLPSRGRRLEARRTAAAGLALGFAGSTRPDALLYLAPAMLMAVTRWRQERAGRRTVLGALAGGALGLLVGLTPFLAYNWVATGNPFRPTQGMEIRNFLPSAESEETETETPPPAEAPRVGFPSAAPWRGGTAVAIQGGGLRLENLPRTLPDVLELIRKPYGDLLVAVAVWGALLALLRRQLLFFATVPYIVLAILFYSCWSKADYRYLCGVYLLMPMLMIEGSLGTLDLVRRSWRTGNGRAARVLAFGFAALVAAGAMLIAAPKTSSALPTLLLLVPGITTAAAASAGVFPGRRIARFAAPALALVLVTLACWRGAQALEGRASFQRPQMLRARAAFAKVVEPGAVVVTTEEVGRPGENIDYYSGVAHAVYLTDLMRWRLPFADAAELLVRAGMKPYLLIPPVLVGRLQLLLSAGARFKVDLVADIPPSKAMDHFVAAAFYPRGVHMHLYRLTPLAEAPTAP